MNKRQIIASLNNIANTLDVSGLHKEATSLTNVMKRLAQEETTEEAPKYDYTQDKNLYSILYCSTITIGISDSRFYFSDKR